MDIDRNLMSLEQWLAWRLLGFGGSDAAGIMGVSKWTTPFEIFLQRQGLIVGRRRSHWEWQAMARGRRLEPEARASHERQIGMAMPSVCVVHPKIPWLRVTADGLNRYAGLGAEYKAPGKIDHAKALRGKVPDYYFWQCVHSMMVTELPTWHYSSYRDGESAPPIVIHRDDKFEKPLFQRCKELWERIQNDDPPYSKHFRSENVYPIFQGGKMSNVFTAKEVIEILRDARAGGKGSLKLAGLEYHWEIGTHKAMAPAAQKPPELPKLPANVQKTDPREELGQWTIPIGQKWKLRDGRLMKGETLASIPLTEIKRFCDYLIEKNEIEALSPNAAEVCDKAELYHFGEVQWRKAAT